MATATERIEDLRVAWERDLEREIFAEERPHRPPGRDPGASEIRVPLDRLMAERVWRIADEAAQRLGCTDPFVLYQTPRADRRLNGQALLGESPFAVRLIGPVAHGLDDRALAALVGHELGHWLAGGPRADPPSRLHHAWELGAPPSLYKLCRIASELTADRFALVAAAELEATVRLEVACETLDDPRAMGLRELDHLAELVRKLRAGEAQVFCETHPSPAFRLYATWLFWRSDLHRELTGTGPGELPVREVDEELRAWCFRAVAAQQRTEAEAAQEAARRANEPRRPSASVGTPWNPAGSHAERTRPAAGLTSEWYTEAAMWSAASAFDRLVTAAVEKLGREGQQAPERAGSQDVRDDDVEGYLQELRLEADAEGGPGAEQLEKRFRQLEERERKKGQ
jgi:hypothetical protein